MTSTTPIWRRTGVRVAAIALAIPVLALAWYLGSPLFLDRTVVEEFPVAAPAESDATAASAGTRGDAATGDDTATGDDVASSPGGDGVEPTAGSEATGGEDNTAEQTAAGDEQPAPDEPTLLFVGEFADADSAHRGSGTAAIYELADGSRILRFENLDVTNGPDLHVILSPAASVSSRADVMTPGYVDLGGLKGNRGDQNYEIPDDVDLSGDVTITIYCQPFHVVFSTASLTAA